MQDIKISPQCCPALSIKDSRSAQAQPLPTHHQALPPPHHKLTTSQPESQVRISKSAVEPLSSKNKPNRIPISEPVKDHVKSITSRPKKISSSRQSPSAVSGFQSDLNALDAVHLLIDGNPRGI